MSEMTLANVTTGIIPRPLRVSLYGVDGVGKTCFGAGAPAPIFIATEDGSHHVNVSRFPVPETWDDLFRAVRLLAEEEHNFQSLTVDSMDWAEALCDQYLVSVYNQTNQTKPITAITDIPFGGWKALKMAEFTKFLDWLSVLVRVRGMHVICISHANIIRFDDPERDAYQRYELKLFPPLAAKVREWSDYNLFANYDTVIQTTGEGFNQRTVGLSHGKRLLFSQRRAAYDAKARFNIPERLDLSWDTFWAAHTAAQQSQQPQ